jgi:hypothetical protein
MVEPIVVGTTLLYFFGLGVLSFYLVEQERRRPPEENNIMDAATRPI